MISFGSPRTRPMHSPGRWRSGSNRLRAAIAAAPRCPIQRLAVQLGEYFIRSSP